MVTPLVATTNSPEIVDELIEKARKLNELRDFLLRTACDLARSKVEWEKIHTTINKEISEVIEGTNWRL